MNNKFSDVTIPEDIPGRVDLLITDALDYGLIGEGILPNFFQAKSSLLKGKGALAVFLTPKKTG